MILPYHSLDLYLEDIDFAVLINHDLDTTLLAKMCTAMRRLFALPSMWKGGSAEFPMASRSYLLIMIGAYLTTIPFYIALWQTIKLLGFIDHGKALSVLSVNALRTIKYCAASITIIYMSCVPLLFPIADADDAPGLLIFGFAFACMPLVVAVFAAVLEKLLENAIAIKSENDLIV